MKSEKVSVEVGSNFPKLMESASRRRVVLFAEPKKGVVVWTNEEAEGYCVGDFRDDWIMHCFTDYLGDILLKGGE